MEKYTLTIKDQGRTCDVKQGERPDGEVTLIMGSETLNAITTGKVRPEEAFFGGKLRLTGDPQLGLKVCRSFGPA
ncbi:SCP2 sterol-binding domain-containing protein [Streptomyces sp. NBC_01276]|uniref:SCP2 sterol-binding domain-containing protein n=1 Tax=Streptomyces sp. NBC_01276 TaxID=2903808 RepID=UPI002F90F475